MATADTLRKRSIEQLEEQYGIQELPYLLLESGKGKVRAFSGDLTKEQINQLSKIVNIELIGSYLLRKEHNLRLSLDATHFLSGQISKDFIEISEEQYQTWIRGYDLQIKTSKGTKIIKFDSFLMLKNLACSNKSKIIQ